jgi:4-hydroxybenzoate polyprenyltransferase
VIAVRIRVLVALIRPPVIVLLGLFAFLGVVQGGGSANTFAVAVAMVVVAGFLLFSVALNDLADEAIDRVNLPTDQARPLVAGTSAPRDMPVVAIVGAITAVVAAATIGWRALAVVVIGMALSAAYSLPPLRLCSRGALASLLLPAGYVAVPFLVGLFSVRHSVIPSDGILLAGLYAGFIGRILLKDFRDVRGDALFGKRTFLVRHGRRATCLTAAAFWVLGASALFGIRDLTIALAAAQVACVGGALLLLRLLARNGGARRDERIISALAILGRGMVVLVIAHLAMTDNGWLPVATNAATVGVAVVMGGQAITMARSGPRTRLAVPAAWASRAQMDRWPGAPSAASTGSCSPTTSSPRSARLGLPTAPV